jgi:SAM-dependent methyltransferase
MLNTAGDAAGPAHWNSVWKNLPPIQQYSGPVIEQHPVLSKFLSRTRGRAIEIGCVPGNFMIYLNKEFGYSVDGLDYSENLEYTRANLERNSVHDAKLYHENAFDFVPETKYDLVFSAGFVEHFDDHNLAVRKHAELAKPGGLVVVIVPNITHVHRVLCGLFAPEFLSVHRFPLMDKRILRETLEQEGLRVVHCEYHRTFRPVYRLPKPLDLVSRGLQKSLRLARLDDLGNRFASPYLISISTKK